MNDIRSISKEALNNFLTNIGVERFRTKQVWNWLWKNFVSSFDEMVNIPVLVRDKLKENFRFPTYEVIKVSESKDGTTKMLIQFFDGSQIESVLIPTEKRLTACISTQDGCPVGCTFCATALMGFKRNLNAGEIYAQVVILNKLALEKFGKQLTNIVIMGMGEPLLNYEQVMMFCNILSSEDGMLFSSGRITLSSIGLPKMIKKLTEDNSKFNLAISLHATSDEKRSKIIPASKAYSIEELIKSLDNYCKTTGKQITFEYILLKDFNDSPEDARNFVKISRKIPSKVNIINYNTFDNTFFEKSDDKTTADFINILEQNRINVRLRISRGSAINAACGQLAGRKKDVK
ncbi:MAG: 23S rRNA (adenine(2503)-C(2))-methyltransferase RlmN [Bacteroidales bacterium]|nr:23S rRNA (adenine(2503)-C(2))-methyltransferase RlmN [Bacteroidales bacterium]